MARGICDSICAAAASALSGAAVPSPAPPRCCSRASCCVASQCTVMIGQHLYTQFNLYIVLDGYRCDVDVKTNEKGCLAYICNKLRGKTQSARNYVQHTGWYVWRERGRTAWRVPIRKASAHRRLHSDRIGREQGKSRGTSQRRAAA